jgi:hypothetical protein
VREIIRIVNVDDEPITLFTDTVSYLTPVRGRIDQTHIVLTNGVTLQVDKPYDVFTDEFLEKAD